VYNALSTETFSIQGSLNFDRALLEPRVEERDMKKRLARKVFLVWALALIVVSSCVAGISGGAHVPNLFPFPNAGGILQTFSTNGALDLGNAFFESLGTNGRSCASCHLPDQGWSIAAEQVKVRFNATAGLDPIFRPNDGANCDHDIDVTTLQGRRNAYSLLTSRGLIRVALPVPSGAEFEIVAVSNPYGCSEKATLSTYRRVLPSANLRFLSAVMWDGRESTPPSTEKITYVTNPNDLLFDLRHQAAAATAGHAQGAVPLPPQQQQEIVDFEMGLYTAQGFDFGAGSLSSHEATGGPVELAAQQFFVGINDPLGQNPFGTAFSPVVFRQFASWKTMPPQSAKARLARGEELFNSKPIQITGVAGLNDDLGVAVIPGTCGTCHDAPNVGNHSVAAPLNIGVGDLNNPLGVGYLPVITLRNKSSAQVTQTTDPGRALITGKWRDIGRMKGPVLRGLASRAPYFHNGSAMTLDDVIEFYNSRFNMNLTAQEKLDLVAFLKAL
jgi:cytochrome c peroxidase